jgi:copper homeostasis protein
MIHAENLGLATTFHRAFDFVEDPESAMQKIVGMGFDRLLSSGLASRAEEGTEILKWLQANYGDVIQIVAGSGIDHKNARIIADTGIQYLHFTSRKPEGEVLELGMGQAMATDISKIAAIQNCF